MKRDKVLGIYGFVQYFIVVFFGDWTDFMRYLGTIFPTWGGILQKVEKVGGSNSLADPRLILRWRYVPVATVLDWWTCSLVLTASGAASQCIGIRGDEDSARIEMSESEVGRASLKYCSGHEISCGRHHVFGFRTSVEEASTVCDNRTRDPLAFESANSTYCYRNIGTR